MVFKVACVALVSILLASASGCKKSEPPAPGAASGSASSAPPAKVVTDSPPVATAGSSATPVQGTPVLGTPAAPLQVESRDILSREPVTAAAQVKHILIGWGDLPTAKGKALERTKEEADRLALELLERVKAGERMEVLMSSYSEDPENARTGDPYAVRVESDFVAEFEALSLRLNLGEAGIVRTQFGYHIIKRVE